MLQPNSTLVYFNLGNIYLEKGYMENAQLLITSMQVLQFLQLLLLLLTIAQMYVHVISLDPLYRGAFNNLGNALKEADFFDHAIRCQFSRQSSPFFPPAVSRIHQSVECCASHHAC